MPSAQTLAEVVGRVVVIYVALLVFVRIAGRRALSDLTTIDILVLLLISETVSPALTANSTSVVVALVAAATLIGLSVLATRLTYRWRRLEHAVDGTVATLIRDGVIDRAVQDRYHVTDDELSTALHEGGALDAGEVRRAFVEPDGKITIVARKH